LSVSTLISSISIPASGFWCTVWRFGFSSIECFAPLYRASAGYKEHEPLSCLAIPKTDEDAKPRAEVHK
jgi:hypothetical protein